MLKPLASRVTRFSLVPALLIAGALATAAPASATDYCVAPNTTCGGTNVGDLQTALDWAGLSDNADRIFLGAGTYTAGPGGFNYDVPTGPVEIIGAGQASTILTGPADTSQRVLRLFGAPGTSVHDLYVTLPKNVVDGAVGIYTNALVRRVGVYEDPTQANSRTGVTLAHGALESSNVWLAQGNATAAVQLSSADDAVHDCNLTAKYPVISYQGGTVERSGLSGALGGVVVYHGAMAISNSVIRVDSNGIGIYAGSGGTNITVKADGLDVVGSGSNITGIRGDNTSAAATNVNITLDNSLMRGVSTPLRALSAAAATGTVHIAASYSDYDGSGNFTSGPKASISEAHISNFGDSGLGPDLGDLTPASPLVDAGDPATPQGLDLDSNPLVTDGDGDGVARRDIGALELPAAPVADGGQRPPGEPSPGESAPISNSSSPAPDTQPPLVTGLSLTRKTFAVGRARTAVYARVRGTTLRYKLSEAATVVIRIKRGLRTAGTLTRRSTAGANAVRFSGRIGRRALKPGRYSAVVSATDAAGNRSRPQRVRFRIVG